MNGTVLPSSSIATTAATAPGASPSSRATTGTGSKWIGALGTAVVVSGVTSSVMGWRPYPRRRRAASSKVAPVTAIDPVRDRLIRRLPKVELHLHIESTLEPEMMFSLAAKHGMALPYHSVDDVRAAYQFSDLQSFLDLYYAGCSVLVDRRDFYALAMAYFTRAHADGVVHAELFFDPQTHTVRGVAFETVIAGLRDAMEDALRRYGITSELILCFLRHLSEDDALATLDAATAFRSEFIGVGLDSGERGNPPSKFARVFAAARDLGLRCDEDPDLVDRLVREQIPLTVCPLSNLKLCVVRRLADHNFARLLRRGV